jgi:hypothetical protein
MMKDGHLNKCIECARDDVFTRYYKDVEKTRENERKRVRDFSRRKGYAVSYREKFPNKYKAHTMVHNHIRDGKLQRKSECSVCSSDRAVHAHHDDYSKPTEVRWLCCVCHRAWHRLNGEAKNPF